VSHKMTDATDYYITDVILLEHCTGVIGLFKFKFEYSVHSIFRKSFNRTQSVPLCTVASHSADS